MFQNIIGGYFRQKTFVRYLFEVALHFILSPVDYGGTSVPLFLRSPGQVGGDVVVVSIWY